MKKKKPKLMTTCEMIQHTPSPVAASLIDCKPKVFTPKKFKKKHMEAYKREIRDYL